MIIFETTHRVVSNKQVSLDEPVRHLAFGKDDKLAHQHPAFRIYATVMCVHTSKRRYWLPGLPGWWAQVDSNHRPRAYQARALTT